MKESVKMKKILLMFTFCTLLFGCTSEEKSSLEAILQENNYIIVDVRTKEEYNELHIQDAINIPYDEITQDITLDKNKTILVYCKSGNRSNIAYNTLNELGYMVYDLGSIFQIDLPKTNQ